MKTLSSDKNIDAGLVQTRRGQETRAERVNIDAELVRHQFQSQTRRGQETRAEREPSIRPSLDPLPPVIRILVNSATSHVAKGVTASSNLLRS